MIKRLNTSLPNGFSMAGDNKYTSIIRNMKRAAPGEFAPVATQKESLKLVFDGDSFHWVKKEL